MFPPISSKFVAIFVFDFFINKKLLSDKEKQLFLYKYNKPVLFPYLSGFMNPAGIDTVHSNENVGCRVSLGQSLHLSG